MSCAEALRKRTEKSGDAGIVAPEKTRLDRGRSMESPFGDRQKVLGQIDWHTFGVECAARRRSPRREQNPVAACRPCAAAAWRVHRMARMTQHGSAHQKCPRIEIGALMRARTAPQTNGYRTHMVVAECRCR